jgi:hypothetical protein
MSLFYNHYLRSVGSEWKRPQSNIALKCTRGKPLRYLAEMNLESTDGETYNTRIFVYYCAVVY